MAAVIQACPSQFPPVLLDFEGRKFQISHQHLLLQDGDAPKPSYRIRDWRLRLCEQLARYYPDLGKGLFLKQLEAGSKALLDSIKLNLETLTEWKDEGHPEAEVQDLEQALQFYKAVFVRVMRGTPHRPYACWEVRSTHSIQAFCIVLGIENCWTGSIPKLDHAALVDRASKRPAPADLDGECDPKRFHALPLSPPHPSEGLMSPPFFLDSFFAEDDPFFSSLPTLMDSALTQISPLDGSPLDLFQPGGVPVFSRSPSPEPTLQNPPSALFGPDVAPISGDPEILAPSLFLQDLTPSRQGSVSPPNHQSTSSTLSSPAHFHQDNASPTSQLSPTPSSSLAVEIAEIMTVLLKPVSAADLGRLSQSWTQLASTLQSAKELRQRLGQAYLPKVREQPEALSVSWGHPDLINDPHYVETGVRSGAVALKSLIPESLLPATVALPAEAHSMLLFLLQDEIPAIAEQLAIDRARMDKPSSSEVISVLVPKTAEQTSALDKNWYRLLLSSPVLGMNRLVENMVAVLDDPTQAFQQGLQRTLTALQPLQDEAAASAQARLQACVEREVAKQGAAIAQKHDALDRRHAQLQQELAQVHKDRVDLRAEIDLLRKQNGLLQTKLEQALVGDGSQSQQSQLIRNIQGELDKLRNLVGRGYRLSASLPAGGLEYGDDF